MYKHLFFARVERKKKQKHQIQWNSYRVTIAHSDRQRGGEQGHPACARPAAAAGRAYPCPALLVAAAVGGVLLTALKSGRSHSEEARVEATEVEDQLRRQDSMADVVRGIGYGLHVLAVVVNGEVPAS